MGSSESRSPSELEGSSSRRRRGFTVIEMLVVMVIMGTLAALGSSPLHTTVTRAKIARATGDIRAIQGDIVGLEQTGGGLPASLAAIGRNILDPWGRPYQYVPFPGGVPPANARVDRFAVPLNSTFDLYSLGEDGASSQALTAAVSQDDVVRGADGGFIGKGADY